MVTPVKPARLVMTPTDSDQPDSESLAGQMIPSIQGVIQAYRDTEHAMFGHPEESERFAEILALTRAQLRDQALGHRTDSEGRHDRARTVPVDPVDLQRLVDVGIGQKFPREKTAREVAEDDLLRAGLAPILASLTIAQLDAVRHVHYFRNTFREGAAALGIHLKTLQERLQGAYTKIRKAIPAEGYRQVVAWLIKQGEKDRVVRQRREESW